MLNNEVAFIIKDIQFDMNYFLMPGVDIDGYDPAFKRYFNKVFGPEASLYQNYKPTNQFNKRNGQFAYWTQTSPVDGAWAFKFSPSNFNATPYLAPFLKESILNDNIQQLQYDKDMIGAYAILAGEIRLTDTVKSGQVADQFAIKPATLGAFMAKAKNGLGNLVKLAALPVENSHFYQYTDNNTSMYTDQLANSAGVGSGVSRVIYSSDRMSNAELEAGITDQYNTMKGLYPQFENFLNFYVNQITKKYKFKFIFDGCTYQFEREKRFNRLLKVSEKGIVLGPSAWASALGYMPQDFDRLLDEGKYSDFKDKWQLMVNANTASMGSTASKDPSATKNPRGRPKKDDGDLSESGELNRNSEGEL